MYERFVFTFVLDLPSELFGSNVIALQFDGQIPVTAHEQSNLDLTVGRTVNFHVASDISPGTVYCYLSWFIYECVNMVTQFLAVSYEEF